MATDARIGSELAGYRIEAPIGRGGMGVVYRAEQLRLGRKVALKLLAPELAENQGFRARFEHESRLAAVLDHPNIVPLFEAGEADGLLFISMRYVEGTDLRDLLSRDGRLEPERALAIAAQVASALDAAHDRGLVHRDVKPGNILIASDVAPDRPEHCYLTDFGLTKDTSSPVELTATGTFVGTIDYIAPEQIEGATAAGRGDQYALGLRALRVPDRPPALPARRRDQRDVGAPAGRAAHRHRHASGAARRHRRRHRARTGQGPREALRDVHGDGRGCPRRAAAPGAALPRGEVDDQRDRRRDDHEEDEPRGAPLTGGGAAAALRRRRERAEGPAVDGGRRRGTAAAGAGRRGSRRRVAPGSNSGSGSSTSISSSVSPRITRALEDTTTTADSRAPSTKVPLVDPRSSSSTPSSWGRTARWRRETSSSLDREVGVLAADDELADQLDALPGARARADDQEGHGATLTGTPARAHCN